MYKRILLKISGEVLSNDGQPVCIPALNKTAKDIKALRDRGVEIGIVIGGGNIMRGRNAGELDRNRMDNMGMLATAINSLALQEALRLENVPSVVFSAIEMQRFCETFSARAAVEALNLGKIVIFACGTGCPFFSTDTAAALRAAEIGADALLLAKSIDAVYSADPNTDPSAVRYERISYDRVISENLQATDLTAITLCKEQHIAIKLFALDKILDAVDGVKTGTIISY
ncbi:MAG: UMP kinase [Eubacteriales bacterium]|nr:UMP kinase [Eubacteriales bacterium]